MSIEQLKEEFGRVFKKLRSGSQRLMVAKVLDVDASRALVSVQDEETGLKVEEVRLLPIEKEEGDTGLVIIPSVGSTVLVTPIDNTEWFVLSTFSIQSLKLQVGDSFSQEINTNGELIFNQGQIGGLVDGKKLVTELNKTNGILNALLQVVLGAPIAEAGGGAPSALQQALRVVLTGKPISDYSDIENPKIKH